MMNIEMILSILTSIIVTLTSIYAFRNHLILLLKESIGNYWELKNVEAMLLEIRILMAIEQKESIYYILKLESKYKSIPTPDGQNRNGQLSYRIKEYMKHQKLDPELVS